MGYLLLVLFVVLGSFFIVWKRTRQYNVSAQHVIDRVVLLSAAILISILFLTEFG